MGVGEPSVTFWRRGGALIVWITYFLSRAKNKPEQSKLCSGLRKPYKKDIFDISAIGFELLG